MQLSTAQKIIRFFTSKAKFEKIMEESKQYKFDCGCGQTTSIWDIGGVRYKASGKPLKGIRCPYCGKFAMRRIYKAG